MKKVKLIPVLLTIVLVTGCESSTTIGPDLENGGDTSLLVESQNKSESIHSHSPVVTFADPEGEPVGSSKVIRLKNKVILQLKTTKLEEQTAATLWLVVFNKPENCDGPCDEPDLFNPATESDVLYSDGRIIQKTGNATYTGKREVGDNSGSLFNILGLPSPGLKDSQKAELHLIVRSHGQLIEGMITSMITTFNGGCTFDGLPNDSRLGIPGPNTCEDLQFSVHKS